MRPYATSLALIAALSVAFAPAAAQESADGGPVPISLDQAVRQAQANSPETVQAKGLSRVANAQYRASLANFLPSLGFQQYAAHLQGVSYQGGVLLQSSGLWSYSQGYGANLMLFDGGQNILDYRAAKASLDAADQNQIIKRFAIALNVKQQYFAVLAAREAVAAARQQLKEADQQMEVTEAKIAGGALSRADSLSSAVKVGEARVAVVTAQGNLVAANTALTRLVGGTREVTAVESDTTLVPTIGLDSATLVRLALNGPAVQQAEHQVAANHLSWWASLSTYLPSLSVGYTSGSGWQTQHFIMGGGTKNSSTSLSFYVSYSLFNGLQRESRVVQADVNSDDARAQLRDSRLAARENIAQYLALFETATTKIALQRLQIESATESVAAKDAQFRAGAVGLVDVLTEQTALAQARQALIQARLDARTAKAQIESIIGKDIE